MVAVNLLTALRGNTSILLQVFKAFILITLANIGSAVVVLILTWPLMYYYGVLGSIAAVALGKIILVVLTVVVALRVSGEPMQVDVCVATYKRTGLFGKTAAEPYPSADRPKVWQYGLLWWTTI